VTPAHAANVSLAPFAKPPETAKILHGTDSGPDQHPKQQPVTSAGGILGPLETIIEKTEETKTGEK